MNQNLSQYKVFYTVAEAGNISRAARELFISQPAISKSISKLEESLNTRLFNRNSRGVTLTPEGTVLYHHVKTAFDSITHAEEELLRIQELGLGHIRIGVSTTLCKYILLPYLKSFLAEHPHIRITIKNQATAETITMLEQGHIDIGLIARPRNLKGLTFLPVTDIEDIFVASPSYLDNLRLREGENADPFRDGTVMLLDQKNMTRRHIDAYLNEQQIEISHIMELSTMDLLIEFARIGLGLGCCIRECVSQDLDTGALVQIPLPHPIPGRTIGFALSASLPPSKAMQSFLQHMSSITAIWAAAGTANAASSAR